MERFIKQNVCKFKPVIAWIIDTQGEWGIQNLDVLKGGGRISVGCLKREYGSILSGGYGSFLEWPNCTFGLSVATSSHILIP